MSKYRWWLYALVGCMAVASFMFIARSDPVNPENFARIRVTIEPMSFEDVRSILGEPTGVFGPVTGRFEGYWYSRGEYRILVVFDSDHRATYKRAGTYVRDSMWTKLLRAVGL